VRRRESAEVDKVSLKVTLMNRQTMIFSKKVC
jgi:hypothetical protein